MEGEKQGEECSKNGAPQQPTGRRGGCSFVHDNKFYLHGGYSGGSVFGQRAGPQLDVLDLSSGSWTKQLTKGEEPDMPEAISGACCTIANGCLYVFGGWFEGLRNASVHELNLQSFVWRELPSRNPGRGPMQKDKAGMVAYGLHMLCVFGGYGYLGWHHISGQEGASYHLDENNGAISWTNELHLFNVPTCEWISPVTTGPSPPPCAAFSFTKVDCSRVVLFGGRQQKERVNEVHILDMSTWHWSGALIPSRPEEPWPAQRSFHTACTLVDPDHVCSSTHPPITCKGCQAVPPPSKFEWLPAPVPDLSHPDETKRWRGDPKLLVMLGMNNDADPIRDGWILNVNNVTWEKVSLPDSMSARIWHTMACHHPTPTSTEIIMFGGCSENIFARSEQLLLNISKTTILHHGISSLYELSCLFILSEWDHFQPLLCHLPLHVEKSIRAKQQRTAELEKISTSIIRL